MIRPKSSGDCYHQDHILDPLLHEFVNILHQNFYLHHSNLERVGKFKLSRTGMGHIEI
jgi:hypothetical protein